MLLFRVPLTLSLLQRVLIKMLHRIKFTNHLEYRHSPRILHVSTGTRSTFSDKLEEHLETVMATDTRLPREAQTTSDYV